MTDTRDLATRDDSALASPQTPDRFGQTILMVREAMLNPAVDAEKARAMSDLMVTLEDRSLKAEFNRDLNAAMMEMPVISKEGLIIIKEKGGERVIQRTRFARFEDIDRVCRPILRRHNLAVRFEVSEEGGKQSVAPIISHANGHTERMSAMSAVIDSSGSKNNVQGAGSTVSYLKRYTYCAALNIITEGIDDDGNQGRGEQVTLPHEREQLILAEARAAHAEGRYLEHFDTLGPKDRAWLLASGHHVEFGGQVSLPSSRAKPDIQPVDDQRPASTPPPPPAQKPKPQTPADWVAALKADLDKRASLDKLDEYMDGKREALDRLKGTDPALWQEAEDHYKARRQVLESGGLL
jgi:hypothetical protein